jgi:hypothetical protein
MVDAGLRHSSLRSAVLLGQLGGDWTFIQDAPAQLRGLHVGAHRRGTAVTALVGLQATCPTRRAREGAGYSRSGHVSGPRGDTVVRQAGCEEAEVLRASGPVGAVV